MIGIQEILDSFGTHHPGTDFELLRKAYAYAAAAHERRTLINGEPFIILPLAVAGLLVQMGQDEATIAAALVMDTVVDGGDPLKGIRAAFGAEVAGLVDGVERSRRLGFDERQEPDGEYLRRLLAGPGRDERVLIIRLADRLHTMRRLDFQLPHRQQRLAREVLNVFVPLADHLGLRAISQELEELAADYLRPYEHCRQGDFYALTPRGEMVFLPKGATPVDFAYQIHREVGDQCVGAKVNGRLVPLKTELSNGDTVEIITSDQGRPCLEWLEFVKTDEARNRLQRLAAMEDDQQNGEW